VTPPKEALRAVIVRPPKVKADDAGRSNMKPEFSEFSYGFALTYEIANALQPEIVATPLFPSPTTETREGPRLSFVKEGWPLFVQFKLAHCLKTSRATQWDSYSAPFFRIGIQARTRSNQYSMLRTLSATEPEIYYAVPAFYRQIEFNQAFVSNQILNESKFVPLRELPDLEDDSEHFITFGRGVGGFRWHSQASTLSKVPIGGAGWLERIKTTALEPRTLGAEYFVGLRRHLVTLLREHTLQPDLFLEGLAFDWHTEEPQVIYRDLRYLLVTYFGLETLILCPKG
jgi:hypothetical protein